MLAPMIREKPVAIAKNEAIAEKLRMVGREDKSTLQHEPGPSSVARKHYGDSRASSEYSQSL
jgi:hypothetical protein